MDLQQILAALLNPNGMQQQNQLSAVGAPAQVGDHANPAMLPQFQQNALQAPEQALAAPQAPQGQPMPQSAPVDVPEPSGGGIGGLLSGLFQGPKARERNYTVGWLQKQGMDEGTATLLAGSKPALQQYLLSRSQGQKPIEVNGRLVDPNTYQVIADFSDKSGSGRRTTTIDGKLVDTDTGQVIGDYGDPEPRTRDLTPEEVERRGLVPGNYQEDAEGNLKVIGTPREQGADFGRLQDVRKEIQQLPSYKNFSQAAPIYDTMVDASTRDSKAADLNLVYGLGKIFDPGSVVREGEMVMVKDTASLPDWLVGAINSLNGGARLQPETRRAILQEAQSRIKAYQGMLDTDLTQYRSLAETYKLDQNHLLPPMPKMRELPPMPSPGVGLPMPPPQGAPPVGAPGGPAAVTPGGQRVIEQMTNPAPVKDWKEWFKKGK